MNKDNWYLNARNDDPTGIRCGFCGGENLNYDDCGWFYLSPFGGGPYRTGEEGPKGCSLPACQACDKGEMGERHRKRYGVGER